MQKAKEAAAYITARVREKPNLALILGSGLGGLAERVQKAVVIPYQDVPHFPQSTVPGHAGRLFCGRLGNRPVMVMQGRFHYYEGYELGQVTFPIRVMQELGLTGVVVTNAAGGIRTSLTPGDLVLIQDHINLMGDNPLCGPNAPGSGPRFPDMSEAYCRDWREAAAQVMSEMGMKVLEGVYAGLSGPSYETPAEIRYLRGIGADMVGMSTVPEVIVANQAGLKVLGISCITNMAAGVLNQKLSHDEVVAVAEKIGEQFAALIERVVPLLDAEPRNPQFEAQT